MFQYSRGNTAFVIKMRAKFMASILKNWEYLSSKLVFCYKVSSVFIIH